ncbi:MAG: DNA-binding protein [Candidatus Celaenobacter antarcticus]|nr:DNA-binding protein [Candidatus Celaenobacter antarcticus]
MIEKNYGSIYCIRTLHGEDFLAQLNEITEKQDFKNAIIISGVGMLKGAKIGYYRGGTYQIKTISDPAELVSTSGNMYINPAGKHEWHVHVALAEHSHEMLGGHLLGGIVWNTAEIFLQIIPDACFVRENEEGNLRLNFK